MSSRFTPLEALSLGPAAQAVVDDVRAGRRRGVPANVVTWLAHPELARRAASLGELVRYGTSLDPRLSELAILVVARHWNCDYEWAIHAAEASRAGVPDEVVEAIGHGREPVLAEPDRTVALVVRQLVASGRLDDGTYELAQRVLGEPRLTDLVAVVGYYTLVAFSLNAREVPAPQGAAALPRR